MSAAVSSSPQLAAVGTEHDLSAAAKSIHACGVPFRCETVTEFARLEELSSDWQRLWECNPEAEIFQTFEWARAWWRSFGQHYALCSFIVHQGDQLVGIVPLVQRDGIIQFLGMPQADYGDILCRDDFAGEVLSAAFSTLLTSLEGWIECKLEHLAKDSRVLRHYGDLDRGIKRHTHLQFSDHYPTIVIGERSGEVFKPLLEKHHTRRRQNKLRKAGRVEFRHIETRSEAKGHLDQFFRHHIRRQALIGRESSYALPQLRQFFRNLIDELEPASKLRFGVLELNGRPFAWDIGFQVNGKFLLYQHTFDLDASDFTPGEVLLWNLLEYARQNITREFDFGSGDEPYKNRFTNQARETFSLFVERPSVSGILRGFRREIEGHTKPWTREVARAAKSQRFLLRLLRSGRLWTIAASARFREARRNGTALQHVRDVMVEIFRNAIWSRERLDVFVYPREGNAGTCPGENPSREELDVKSCGFGELVDLAAAHPRILALNDLQRCRQRMRAGDQVYVARHNLQAVLVGWASNSANFDALTGTSESGQARVAMTIDECLPDRALNGPMYGKVLNFFISDTQRRNAEPLVWCRLNQSGLREELVRQGFVHKCRVTRYRLFKWFRREVVAVPEHG